MKVIFILQLVTAVAFAGLQRSDNTNEIVCPINDKNIEPCTCVETGNEIKYIQILCNGPQVTQKTINKLMPEIRKDMNMKSSDSAQFFELQIQNTSIKTLDLRPLSNIIVQRLSIWSNKNLSLIVPPSSKNYESISAMNVIIGAGYQLTKDGFGDALKYFYKNMAILQVSGVNMNQEYGKSGKSDDNLDDDELLPGISSFTQLRTIHFIFNRMAKLGPRKFRKNTRLTYIDLYGNGMTEIDDEAFLLDPYKNQEENNDDNQNKDPLNIELNWNRLTPSSFSARGMETLLKLDRPVRLGIQTNDMDTIPEGTFKTFLQRDPENTLDFYGNPLNCDRRVRWLKQGAKRFQKQVFSASCRNDAGRTVFNSTRV